MIVVTSKEAEEILRVDCLAVMENILERTKDVCRAAAFANLLPEPFRMVCLKHLLLRARVDEDYTYHHVKWIGAVIDGKIKLQ